MNNTDLSEGVFTAQKKDGSIYYRSSLTYNRKHISLGSYSTPNEAHNAYLEAKECLYGSCDLHDYSENHSLSFEKWVILINLRDNDIYFSTPIYAKGKFFEYHLDPQTVLKFDMDDLFYFSSHKIMKRGNHLFVADYGMQVSVLSRFGIKNYAVTGQDYSFVNNDVYDFRRENLIIKNKYHGVICVQTDKGTKYKTRIHVNGYYQVGIYNTDEEAAIAYNKAIDILKKNGLKKNYTANYLEGISPKKYADIYSSLSISEKIYKFNP